MSADTDTAKLLESKLSDAEFELLATSILRFKYPQKCATLLHTGVNSDNKTRKSSLDGFCKVPYSNPPEFILVETTTTKIVNLEKKWLHDHKSVTQKKANRKNTPSENDDGDLVKANREAKKLRKKFSNAIFTVYLNTNRRVDTTLSNRVYELSQEWNLNTIIIENSTITHFLDNIADGQFLRRKYLNIDCERISTPFLQELSLNSLNEYKNFIHQEDWMIQRNLPESSISSITYSDETLHFLEGESGHGKSTLAFELLNKHISNGGIGFWIQDEILTSAPNLQDAFNKTLKSILPTVPTNSYNETFPLLNNAQQLLLVVDDVNRSNSPQRLITKLITFHKDDSNTKNDTSIKPIKTICPIWTKNLSAVSQKENSTIAIHEVPGFTKGEAIDAVKKRAKYSANIALSETQCTEIADQLGNDPILIGLCTNFLNITSSNIVITQYIESCLNILSQKHQYLLEEYTDSLTKLVILLLQNRNFNPDWQTIQTHFNTQDDISVVRQIIDDSKICRMFRIGEARRLSFRHDRIREEVFVSAIQSLITNNYQNPILLEPYYTKFVAKAIVRSNLDLNIRYFRNHAPLVLLEVIRESSNENYTNLTVVESEALSWAKNNVGKGLEFDSVVNVARKILEEIDNTIVLKIIEYFPSKYDFEYARMRNADLLHAVVKYNKDINFNSFEAGTGNSFRDRSIRYLRKNHESKFKEKFINLYSSQKVVEDKSLNYGILMLIGFLQYGGSEYRLRQAWSSLNKTKSMKHSVAVTLWSALRCWKEDLNDFLAQIVYEWQLLSDEAEKGRVSDRYWVTKQLGFSFKKYPICESALQFLISKSEEYPNLKSQIIRLCEKLLTPIAVNFIVENLDTNLLYYSTTKMDTLFSANQKMHEAAFQLLEETWSKESTPVNQKNTAFRLWLSNTSVNDLDKLREFDENSLYFDSAVIRRVLLGDTSVSQEFLSECQEDPHYLENAYRIWNTDIKRYVKSVLLSLPNYSDNNITEDTPLWFLGDLLTRIPISEACNIIDSTWSNIHYYPDFISAALFINGEKYSEKINEKIYQNTNNIDIFEPLHRYLIDMSHGDSRSITVNQLKGLEAYLEYFNGKVLYTILESALQIDALDWVDINLKPLKSKISILIPKTTNGRIWSDWEAGKLQYLYSTPLHAAKQLTKQIEKSQCCELCGAQNWIWHFSEIEIRRFGLREILKKWIDMDNLNLLGMTIVAQCIESAGNRSDLEILNQFKDYLEKDDFGRIFKSCEIGIKYYSLT